MDGMWADLLPVGRDGTTGGYRRYAWTPSDLACREWFAGEAARRGLDLVVDRNGNQWAWWGDPDADGPGVVTGSHLDSVPDGGAFDGPLGVVSALAAVDLMREQGVVPARPLGVVSFTDEEGARFGIACAGSRLLTGALDADRARRLTDADGTTLAEAMRAAGHDPEQLGRDDETLRRVGTLVELHVEQGRALVDAGAAVGVAHGIWPHGRWRLDLDGEANHAGTTRLVDRDDPMLRLAAAVLSAREAATARGAVATIGRVTVAPNGTNAIPSRVRAWLDARGADEADVRAVVAAVAVAAGTEPVEESWTPLVAFAADLRDRLADRLGDAPVLPTAAGHDAGILAGAGVEAGMLFVRNPTGVSHSPAEHAETDDCHAGVTALATVLVDLTGARR
ncbi:MAG: beta-ureidopropionase / N-carbamoyl-L-amino-acid hydrolase [Actinomycetota bacterium]|nr:beta-ureidopropionase / N-carbamoyl-L-amino-acid hydrolase [Actinomycetota bacterium]